MDMPTWFPQKPKEQGHYIRTVDEVKEAIELNGGLLSFAARSLGISRSALSERIKKNPDLAAFVQEIREETLDKAENQLIIAMESGDIQAIKFMLRNLGKERGYIERRELTGKDGQALMTIGLEERLNDALRKSRSGNGGEAGRCSLPASE